MDTRTKSNSSDDGPYFNDFKELIDEIGVEIEQVSRRQACLKKLGQQIKEIDCDYGIGNLEVHKEVIKATIQVTDVGSDTVDNVINGYNWHRKFEVTYCNITKTVAFEMKADIDQICTEGVGQ